MRAFILTIAILVAGNSAVSAQQSEKPPATKRLQVGMAATEITPPVGYPMSGYYYERGASGVLDPLHAKAIAFDDGTTKVAIVVCDLIGISIDLCHTVRERVSEELDISPHNIMIAATHCHTGPDYYADLRRFIQDSDVKDERVEYAAHLVTGITDAVKNALADLSPATLNSGLGIEKSVSFNRRFVMSDGSIRTWANYRDPSVVRAAGPIDPALDMLLIKDASKSTWKGSLSVFALHLDTTGGSKFSADFPFHMERTIRSKLGDDFQSVFAAGTCGDINHVNPRSKDRNRPHVIGARLGKAFVDSMSSLKEVTPSIKVDHRHVEVPLKSFTKEQLDWALELIEKDKAGDKVPFLDEVQAYKIRLLSIFRDGYTTKNRSDQPRGTSTRLAGIGESLPTEVQVIQLGEDTAIVGLPGEVFVELGLAIKQASPYRQTLVIELANSVEAGYIPTRLAYQGGGYEVLNSAFQPGGGELLVETAVSLLRRMKSDRPK